MQEAESHYVNRTAWLRAAVLGANDGIISTASLIVGVAAAGGSRGEHPDGGDRRLGGGGNVDGGGRICLGQLPSGSSEAADLKREQRALSERPAEEKEELAHIYEERGLQPKLARKVAKELMSKDALAAHARDELGFSEESQPRPIQAALASALAFSVGAAAPTLAAFLAPHDRVVVAVSGAALVFLVALGALGAWAGGAPIVRPALRVGFWGAFAMAVTAGIGALVGRAV